MAIADLFSSSSASSSQTSLASSTADARLAGTAPSPATGAPKVQTSDKLVNPLNPQGIKPCCACPTTKSARDECFLVSGLDPTSPEGQDRCKDFVERHRECMRGYGFKV